MTAIWADGARALCDHLWQSTAFLGIVALLAILLRKDRARTRYWLWMAAAAKFLIPLSLLVNLSSHLPWPSHAAAAQTSAFVAIDEVSQPFTDTAGFREPVVLAAALPVASHPALPLRAAMLGTVWLLGTMAMTMFWLVQWRCVAKVRRFAQPLEQGREVELLRRLERIARLPRPIPLLSSNTSLEPGVFGILRPVLLWPEGISHHLDDAHLESILAHEVCHVQRRDNLTSVIPMLVEAIFWFNPLVWWMGQQLVKERERACDEEVLLVCASPEAYAESILKVCEFCVESPLTCISGITGADLKQRVVQIVTGRVVRRLTLAKKSLLLAFALAAVSVPIVLGQAKTAERMAWATLDSFRVAKAAIAVEDASSVEELQASGPATDEPAKTDPSGPAFAATIRPSNLNDGRRMFGIQFPAPGRLVISSVPLKTLVMFAYGSVQMQRVEGGPPWTDSDQFDITAQVDTADSLSVDEHMQPMLQALLAQRFKLKGHMAMISTPAYVLVQTAGGSKLKEVPAPTPAELQEDEKRREANKATDPPQFGLDVSTTGWVGHAVKIQELMGGLGYALTAQNKPMLDQTGLTGYYDVALRLIKQEGGPTPEQQVEEQLGLRLELRNVPMNTFVIDSAEKPKLDAAENAAATPDVEPAPVPPPHIDFEVVSWKRCAGNAVKGSGRVDLPIDSDFVAYHCQPVRRIIYFAFTGPAPFELSGHPAWVDDDLYEFTAKVAPKDIAAWQAMTINDKRIAVRDILTDQLKLKLHVDKTPQPAYALTVAKGGPKLTEYKLGEQWKLPDGQILEGRQHVFIGGVTYMQNSTMNNVAANLSARLDRPVLDQTGLTGSYDISLPLAKAGVANPFAGTDDDPSVESGLELLGLKLVSAKIEADGLVVDHIERPPGN